MIIVTIMNVVI